MSDNQETPTDGDNVNSSSSSHDPSISDVSDDIDAQEQTEIVQTLGDILRPAWPRMIHDQVNVENAYPHSFDTDAVTEAAHKVVSALRPISRETGYGRDIVFIDFIDILLATFTGDEDKYRRLFNKYDDVTSLDSTDDEHPFSYFAEAKAILSLETAKTGLDVLGEVYMLEQHNSKELQQFFTPHSVTLGMAEMTGVMVKNETNEIITPEVVEGNKGQTSLVQFTEETVEVDDETETVDVARVSDPAGCGSGRLVILAAKPLLVDEDFDGKVVVRGIDISPICAKMSTINLFLHRLDGVIEQGDGLTLDTQKTYVVTHSEEASQIKIGDHSHPSTERESE